jgi:mannitol/fructose-specific phosphotransferase system IIA component (Ntr-type)
VFLLTTAAGVAMGVAVGQVSSPLRVGQSMLKTAVTGLAAGALAWVGVRQYSRLARAEHDGIGPAVFGVGLALLAGGVFWFLDLSPLLGAYAMGVAFSTTEDRHAIQDRLEFVHASLVPACFALVGTAVDPGLLIQPGVLLFAGVFTGVVLLTKVAGCALPAWFAGLNARGCLRVGLGMMPRGEIALAVALTALAAGVLSAELLAVVVALFLVAGVLAPLLTERAFARGGAGTRGGHSVPANQRSTFSFPSPNAARLVMNSLIELFEDEGFQVGLLHRRDALYQFTREDSVIGVQRIGSEIVFTCGARERELAHTVMIEVVAGMEQNLRDLRKALDAGVLRRQMREEPSPPALRPAALLDAVLRDALSVATMRPRLRSADKAGVIAELLDLLHENGLISDLPAAAVAVFEREQSLSTGLGHGIALPHGRTDAVDRLVCAVGLKPEGVAFDGEDGKPARIVVLVLAPLRASAPQLRFISLISQKLNEEGRAALLASETPEEMLAILTDGGQAHAAHRRSALLTSLAWQSISLDLRAAGKEEALDQLVALCARSGAVTSPDEARQAVFSREGEYASVIEDGVALPHARTAAVERVVCAFGISRAGVSFDANGGPQAHFLAMVLAPPGAAAEYTRLVGILARALDAEGRQALLAAKSSQEALSILSSRGEARDR